MTIVGKACEEVVPVRHSRELNWAARANREAVGAMVSGIAHRGPDDRGLWSTPNGVCTLGHARLSVVDLSPAGHQPKLREAEVELAKGQTTSQVCRKIGTTDSDVVAGVSVT